MGKNMYDVVKSNILDASMSDETDVFSPKIWTKSRFSPILTIFTPPYDIHGWKATDLSFDLAPSDHNFMHPTSRQNFGDGPGQTPKLILTLCHRMIFVSMKIAVSFEEY